MSIFCKIKRETTFGDQFMGRGNMGRYSITKVYKIYFGTFKKELFRYSMMDVHLYIPGVNKGPLKTASTRWEDEYIGIKRVLKNYIKF